MDKIGQILQFSSARNSLTSRCYCSETDLRRECANVLMVSRSLGTIRRPGTCSRMARFKRSELLCPLRGVLGAGLIADRAGRRKAITPLIRSNGFDDHARVMSLLTRRNDWIKRATPGTAQDVN